MDPGRWRNLWIFQKFADHRDDRTARFNRPNPHSNRTGVRRADHDIDGSKPDRHSRPSGFRRRRELADGYWLDPARTIAIEGSAFFVQGNSGSISQAPTTARTSTFVNTTSDVFVGLVDDTTTTSVTNAVISDQFYGADANFRMRTPLFASLPNFDVMFGLRYTALSERLTADVNSVSSHIFQPGLGLPKAFDFTNSSTGTGSFTIRNDITDTWSLILAYNYIYLSSVGRVGDQVTSPADIRQSGFFAQGITLGAKAQF